MKKQIRNLLKQINARKMEIMLELAEIDLLQSRAKLSDTCTEKKYMLQDSVQRLNTRANSLKRLLAC